MIGLRDLYDQMQTVSNGYMSLSAKLDTALISQTMSQQSFAQQLADLRHTQNDHEMRLRQVEARAYISPRAMWTGVAVIVSSLGTIFAVLQAIAIR